MSELVRITRNGMATSDYAGQSVNAGQLSWTGMHPDTWYQLSEMPAHLRQQFTANGFFPHEVHAFSIGEPYLAEVRGVPGFVAVSGWLMGDTHFLEFDVYRPEDGDDNSWIAEGDVTKFISTAQAKEFESIPSVVEEVLSTSNANDVIPALEHFGEPFKSLPADVRRKILSISKPTTQREHIYKFSEPREPGALGLESLEVALLTADGRAAIAVAAKTSVAVAKDCETSVFEDAMLSAIWTVRIVRGDIRENS
jgi:hypothetical protein